MNIDELRSLWRQRSEQGPLKWFSKDLIARALAHQIQEEHLGGLDRQTRKLLASAAKPGEKPPRRLKVGSLLVREHQGVTHVVLVVPDGFCWRGETYSSLSTIAKAITGTSWNGLRFFGLKNGDEAITGAASASAVSSSDGCSLPGGQGSADRRPTDALRECAVFTRLSEMGPRKLASPRRSVIAAAGRTKQALNREGEL